MNQPNLSVMAPKNATVPSETVDVLALLKRFSWLLIAGAVVGAVGSGAYFAYAWRYQAEYTASIPFQVLPPPSSIGSDQIGQTIRLERDDTSQIINRQMFIFQQENFLKDVMASAEFHPDDKPNHECAWLALHKRDPMKYLKRDLVVVPRINAASFEVTMTTRDAAESFSIVQAAVKVYLQRLTSDSRLRRDKFLDDLKTAVKDKQDEFEIKSAALVDYSKRNNIDVLKSSYEIEKSALTDLNREYTLADASAKTAEESYKAIIAKSDAKEDIPLSSDLLQSIENDYTLKTLLNTRLSWYQERAAAVSAKTTGGTTSDRRVQEIDARIAEVDSQIKDTREKLTKDARSRYVTLLHDESTSKRNLADYVKQIRKDKEDHVTNIGQNLLVWEQRVDEVKEAGDIVAKLRNQLSLAQANRATDDTRVSKIDDPVLPEKPSWPRWYFFLIPGTFAGLGLSTLLAYLIVLTDTRVRTPRDIAKTLQLPVLGFVPDEADDRMLTGDVETAILSSPASMVAESFRQIRSHINAQTAHNPVNSIVVASIGPGGGASTVASNLAASMALNELRVLLVDANLYRPSLDRIYNGLPKEGFTNAVADASIADTCIMPHPSLAHLHLMGVGTGLAGASSELFEGKNFRELLDRLKSKYDLVIFDGSPFNLVADSLALASRTDGVVTVVRAGEISRGAVARVRDQLRSVHANLLGFVLNAAQTSNTGYFKETYKSFYRYAANGQRAKAAT
jgi:capsular exopolysaccharide synthesis family protein